MDQLDRARRMCLALPEATEKQAWGEPTFRVRNKMFAMYHDDHHGDGRVALWCKSDFDMQETLVAAEPDKFFVPPYMGPSGWVGLQLDRCDDDVLAYSVREAYLLAAPMKLRMLLDEPDG